MSSKLTKHNRMKKIGHQIHRKHYITPNNLSLDLADWWNRNNHKKDTSSRGVTTFFAKSVYIPFLNTVTIDAAWIGFVKIIHYLLHIFCFQDFESYGMYHHNTLYVTGKSLWLERFPDSEVHGVIIRPIWGQQDPGWPHVGPMNFPIWGYIRTPMFSVNQCCHCSVIYLNIYACLNRLITKMSYEHAYVSNHSKLDCWLKKYPGKQQRIHGTLLGNPLMTGGFHHNGRAISKGFYVIAAIKTTTEHVLAILVTMIKDIHRLKCYHRPDHIRHPLLENIKRRLQRCTVPDTHKFPLNARIRTRCERMRCECERMRCECERMRCECARISC